MTIKMMISTSKMSMSGTTLGVDNAPWPSPPTSIPIAILLWAQGKSISAGRGAAPGGIRRGFKQSANEWQKALQFQRSRTGHRASRPSVRRRTRSWHTLLHLLGQQPKLIDTGRTDLVDNGDDITVFGSSITLHVNGLVNAIGDAILDLTGKVFLLHLCVANENPAIASNGHDNGVVLVGVLHFAGILDGSHVDGHVLGEQRSDHHKDDEQDEHNVRHRYDVGGRHLRADYWLISHGLPQFTSSRRGAG